MEFFLNRWRNLSVLLLAILVQLGLLAYQVKTSHDVRLIRVWAITAVTPLARVIEFGRGGVLGFFRDYFALLDARAENKRITAELKRAEIDNQYLRAELSSADRAKPLAIFQAASASKTVGARIIGNTSDMGGKTVIVDRGSSAGIQKGMAVITAEGIVGKVVEVYPTASNVLLITDAAFRAGVVSANNHVHGVLKGQGQSTVIIDYVQNEEKVEPGEWFLTAGDDLVFPRGLKVGQVTTAQTGVNHKEIRLVPSGLPTSQDGVLIVTEGVHGVLSEAPLPNQTVHLLSPPAEQEDVPATGAVSAQRTDADRIRARYQAAGQALKHTYGDKNSPAPNFNSALDHP